MLLCLLAHAGAHSERRFALVVGENAGLSTEERLRFADADARRFRDVLVDVGQVALGDVLLLESATPSQLRAQLATLGARLAREATPADRLIVYVSSHAGEGVLHLDGAEFALSELTDFVKAAPVGVGLLIVDACRSGAVTRQKGLKAATAPPVQIEAAAFRGRVFISSSGVDEYAQESEALKGSTFTHHLVAGLRGAADASRDGRVSLEEVYSWSWARTLEATFGSRGGVQQPAFSIDLQGQGPLIVSEPGRAGSRLVFDVEAPGQWLVISEESGAIEAEIAKPSGPLSLSVRPGGYRVRLRTEDGVLERRVSVDLGQVTRVRVGDMERQSLASVVLKGAPELSWTLSAGPSVTSGLVAGVAVLPGADVRLRLGGRLFGPVNEVSVAVRGGSLLSAGPAGFRESEFTLTGALARRTQVGRFSFTVGLELGPLFVLQTQLPDSSTRASWGAVFGAHGEVRLVLAGALGLFVGGGFSGALVRKVAGFTVVPRGVGTAGVTISF